MSNVDPRQFVGVQTWTPGSDQRGPHTVISVDPRQRDGELLFAATLVTIDISFQPLNSAMLGLQSSHAFLYMQIAMSLIVKGIQSVFDSKYVN